jgi:hypothetical protein
VEDSFGPDEDTAGLAVVTTGRLGESGAEAIGGLGWVVAFEIPVEGTCTGKDALGALSGGVGTLSGAVLTGGTEGG